MEIPTIEIPTSKKIPLSGVERLSTTLRLNSNLLRGPARIFLTSPQGSKLSNQNKMS